MRHNYPHSVSHTHASELGALASMSAPSSQLCSLSVCAVASTAVLGQTAGITSCSQPSGRDSVSVHAPQKRKLGSCFLA